MTRDLTSIATILIAALVILGAAMVGTTAWAVSVTIITVVTAAVLLEGT